MNKTHRNQIYYEYIKDYYKEFIDQIFIEAGYNDDDEFDKCGDLYIEAGCQFGLITKALLERQPDAAHLLIDSKADNICEAANLIGIGIDVAFSIKCPLDGDSYIDTHVIHSLMMLDSLDALASELIETQLKYAEVVIHTAAIDFDIEQLPKPEKVIECKEYKILVWRN